MIKVGVKTIVFICLFLVQVVVGLVYKFSLTNGEYNYSTISAITMAEITKFCMSVYISVGNGSTFLKLKPNRIEFTLILIVTEKIGTIHFYLDGLSS